MRRALVVHYGGLGNGIQFVPVLKSLEENRIKYYHTDNPFFTITELVKAANFQNLLGIVPALWRRFEIRDWQAINEFLREHEVETIINFRLPEDITEGAYLGFKKAYPSVVEYWDFFGIGPGPKKDIVTMAQELLAYNGVPVKTEGRQWLEQPEVKRENLVGLFVGASQTVKRWSKENWVHLGRQILASTDCKLAIFEGDNSDADKVVSAIATIADRNGRVVLVPTRPFAELIEYFSRLRLLVSNDTMAIHLATALNTPTVGLYFSTDSKVFGGSSEFFLPIQSQFGLECRFMKNSGSCMFYYGGCPAPCKDEVTSEKVFHAIASTIAKD